MDRLTLFRTLGFVIVTTILVTTVSFVLDWTRLGGHGRDTLARPLNLLAQDRAAIDAEHPVLLIGDSMLLSWHRDQNPATSTGVPDFLTRFLAEHEPTESVGLATLAVPGLGFTSYYYLADELASMGWSVVLIEVNPRMFGSVWSTGESRPEISRYLPLSGIGPTLTLPLHEVGLTADQLLLGPVLRQAGGEAAIRRVQRLQRQIRKVDRNVRKVLDEHLGSGSEEALRERLAQQRNDRNILPDRHRQSRERAIAVYGPILDHLPVDHPGFPFLAAAVERFQARGITVLAFVPPVNVEHLQALDLYDRQTFEANLDTIGEVVTTAGGQWLDLHATLPDASFRDAAGHLTEQTDDPGAAALARALVPLVEAGLERAQDVRQTTDG